MITFVLLASGSSGCLHAFSLLLSNGSVWFYLPTCLTQIKQGTQPPDNIFASNCSHADLASDWYHRQVNMAKIMSLWRNAKRHYTLDMNDLSLFACCICKIRSNLVWAMCKSLHTCLYLWIIHILVVLLHLCCLVSCICDRHVTMLTIRFISVFVCCMFVRACGL